MNNDTLYATLHEIAHRDSATSVTVRAADLRAVLKRIQPATSDAEERLRMILAWISIAAIGYWKEGDTVSPEYDTVALRDVAKLYAKYAQLHSASTYTDENGTVWAQPTAEAYAIVCKVQDKYRNEAASLREKIAASEAGAVPVAYVRASDLVRLRNHVATSMVKAPRDGFVAIYTAAPPSAPAAERPTDDQLWDKTLKDRDDYHDMADKLAQAIADHFGVDIGEHSSANCPWANALDAFPADPAGAPLPWTAKALYDAIKKVIRGHHVSNWVGDDGEPFPLVDMLCDKDGKDISSGEAEIVLLCDAIYNDVLTKAAPAAESAEPALVRDWNSYMDERARSSKPATAATADAQGDERAAFEKNAIAAGKHPAMVDWKMHDGSYADDGLKFGWLIWQRAALSRQPSADARMVPYESAEHWHSLYRNECRARQDDAFRYGTQIQELESRQPSAAGSAETITIQEVWEAAGGNPGIKATKADLLASLRMLDQVCDEAATADAQVAEPYGWIYFESREGTYGDTWGPYFTRDRAVAFSEDQDLHGQVALYTGPVAATSPVQLSGNSGELTQGDERAQEIERLLNDVLIAGAFDPAKDRRAAKKAALDYILAALSHQPSAPTSAADVQDAARWRMLPAFFEDYQINGLQLSRDIDAALAAAKPEGGA